MNQHCERSWEIDAYNDDLLGEKEKASFDRHLESCAACADAKERAKRMRALGEALPDPAPSELALRRLRARVLRSVALGETGNASPRQRMVGASVAALLVVSLSVVAVGRFHASYIAPSTTAFAATSASAATIAPAPELAGTIRADEGAVWQQTRGGAVEHVTLTEGVLHVHVRHQNSDERFFVDMPDGTIEVRGTTFDVEAHDGHAKRVVVFEGVVAWRHEADPEVLLHAGESWSPPVAQPSVAVAPAPHVASTAAIPSPALGDDGSADYAAAMDLFRSGNALAAADAFGGYVANHPHGADAEDASYLRAVALARANHTDDAARAAAVHLSAYPASFHRKEASILIARAARDHGDCAKAAAILAPWVGVPYDKDVAATLSSCEAHP